LVVNIIRPTLQDNGIYIHFERTWNVAGVVDCII